MGKTGENVPLASDILQKYDPLLEFFLYIYSTLPSGTPVVLPQFECRPPPPAVKSSAFRLQQRRRSLLYMSLVAVVCTFYHRMYVTFIIIGPYSSKQRQSSLSEFLSSLCYGFFSDRPVSRFNNRVHPRDAQSSA